MAAITITLTSTCAGGGHLTFGVTGAATRTVPVYITDLSQAVTDDDAEAFCRVVAKLAKSGRTVAQARTLLTAGVTVNV